MHENSPSVNTISNPAKILRAFMKSSGVTNAAALAEMLDIPVRTIQRLKLEIADASCANAAINGGATSAKCANDAISGVSSHIEERARLKENLSGLSSSKEDIPPSPPEPREGRKRGSRLPDDWKLPEDWRQWAKVNCAMVTDAAIAKEAEVFRDYWIAKPGAQACKLDWEATWRNWCRKAFSPAGLKQPARTGVFRPSPQPALSTPNTAYADPEAVRRLLDEAVRGYA